MTSLAQGPLARALAGFFVAAVLWLAPQVRAGDVEILHDTWGTPQVFAQPTSTTLQLDQMWSRGQATGKGTVRFTRSPMRVEDIERIVPYGLMVGGHVCPIDHGYFFPKQLKPGQPHFDVMTPADGFIVIVGHRTQLAGTVLGEGQRAKPGHGRRGGRRGEIRIDLGPTRQLR